MCMCMCMCVCVCVCVRVCNSRRTFIQALSQWTKSHKNLIQQQAPGSPAPRGDKDRATAAASRNSHGAPGNALRAPANGGGGMEGLMGHQSHLRASTERLAREHGAPRSAKHVSAGSGGQGLGEGEAASATGKPRQRDHEHNIWPTLTRDPSSKRDAHEMLERVRREEAELLKNKLKTIREQEDRLQVTGLRVSVRKCACARLKGGGQTPHLRSDSTCTCGRVFSVCW